MARSRQRADRRRRPRRPFGGHRPRKARTSTSRSSRSTRNCAPLGLRADDDGSDTTRAEGRRRAGARGVRSPRCRSRGTRLRQRRRRAHATRRASPTGRAGLSRRLRHHAANLLGPARGRGSARGREHPPRHQRRRDRAARRTCRRRAHRRNHADPSTSSLAPTDSTRRCGSSSFPDAPDPFLTGQTVWRAVVPRPNRAKRRHVHVLRPAQQGRLQPRLRRRDVHLRRREHTGARGRPASSGPR